jgi:hypothetical protein
MSHTNPQPLYSFVVILQNNNNNKNNNNIFVGSAHFDCICVTGPQTLSVSNYRRDASKNSHLRYEITVFMTDPKAGSRHEALFHVIFLAPYFTYCVTGNPMRRLGVYRNENFRTVFKPWKPISLA